MASEERIRAFIDFLSGNPKLHEEIKSASTLGEAIAMAKDSGFEDAEDILSSRQEVVNLQDKDLESVAGGFRTAIGPAGLTCPLTCWCG